LTVSQLEEIAAWCGMNPELEKQRQQARRTFFGEDDPRPTHYWEGAGDYNSRPRRFLGWFMFSHELLPEGDRPAAWAVSALYRASVREEALRAVNGAG